MTAAATSLIELPPQHEQSRLPSAVSPRSTMDMVQEAVMRGAPMELIDKLVALHERFEANQGRKAFDQAIAGAKGEIPVILKQHKGHSGKYEDMGDIAEAVAPILSKFGLSYRYRAEQSEKTITVTCVVCHRDGYSEETKLSSPPDTSGNKTPIHAMASALTYLQRYTLKLALGLAASKDDDGQAAGRPQDTPIGLVGDAQIAELEKLATDGGVNIERFCAHFKIKGFPQIKANEFDGAKKALEKAIENKRKKASVA